jgi:toxin ParE1/3/4
MAQIVWTARALRDLASLREYISRERPTAERQVGRTLSAVQRLTEFPQSGRPGRRPGTRELVVVSRTAYLVAYRIQGELIEALAVLHGHQRWPDSL